MAVIFRRADLASVEDARAVIAAADERFGRVDVLVNAAGLTQRGTLLDTTPELFDRMFAVNVRGPFFLMQDAARLRCTKPLLIGLPLSPNRLIPQCP